MRCLALARGRRRTGIAVLLLALLAWAAPAMAQVSARDAATNKLREGNGLFEQRHYQAALDRYLEARALYPSPRLDYNIASAYDELGQHAAAATFYARFVRQLERPDADSNRVLALRRLEELRRELGSLTLRCTIAGTEVLLDGRSLGKVPLLDDPLYLEPGVHVLRAQHASHPPFLRDLNVAAGASLTVVVPWTASGATSSPERASLLVSKPAPDDAAQLRRHKTIWGYSALGVGLGLAAAAGVLCGLGFAEGNQAYDDYRAAGRGDVVSRAAMDEAYAPVDSAEKKLIAADVLAGAAALSLALSIYELVTRPALEPRTAPRVQLAPQLGSMSLVGSF